MQARERLPYDCAFCLPYLLEFLYVVECSSYGLLFRFTTYTWVLTNPKLVNLFLKRFSIFSNTRKEKTYENTKTKMQVQVSLSLQLFNRQEKYLQMKQVYSTFWFFNIMRYETVMQWNSIRFVKNMNLHFAGEMVLLKTSHFGATYYS